MDVIEWTLNGLVVILVLNVLACLVRIARGPSANDRVAGVVLAGTTGAAILALLSVTTDTPAVLDGALILVALALVITVATTSAVRMQQ